MTRITLVMLVLGVALLLVPADAVACPMCKDTIASTDSAAAQNQYGSGGPQGSLPSGFNFSIYYMLGGLFCTIGLIAGVVTKGIRDSNAAMSRRGFEPMQKKPRA